MGRGEERGGGCVQAGGGEETGGEERRGEAGWHTGTPATTTVSQHQDLSVSRWLEWSQEGGGGRARLPTSVNPLTRPAVVSILSLSLSTK